MILECAIELALSMHCGRHRRHVKTSLGVEKALWWNVWKYITFISVFECALEFKRLNADSSNAKPSTLNPTNLCFPRRNSKLWCETARCYQSRSNTFNHKHQYYIGISMYVEQSLALSKRNSSNFIGFYRKVELPDVCNVKGQGAPDDPPITQNIL